MEAGPSEQLAHRLEGFLQSQAAGPTALFGGELAALALLSGPPSRGPPGPAPASSAKGRWRPLDLYVGRNDRTAARRVRPLLRGVVEGGRGASASAGGAARAALALPLRSGVAVPLGRSGVRAVSAAAVRARSAATQQSLPTTPGGRRESAVAPGGSLGSANLVAPGTSLGSASAVRAFSAAGCGARWLRGARRRGLHRTSGTLQRRRVAHRRPQPGRARLWVSRETPQWRTSVVCAWPRLCAGRHCGSCSGWHLLSCFGVALRGPAASPWRGAATQSQ